MSEHRRREEEGHGAFPTAREDAERAGKAGETPQTRSPSYRLAFTDTDFMLQEELRPVRLQLELLKPELLLQEAEIDSTIVVFGSARIPPPTGEPGEDAESPESTEPDMPEDRQRQVERALAAKSRYYEEARKLARLVSERCQKRGPRDFVVVSGGGPGIMEAANRGADDVGAVSIGLNITLPHEQAPNRFITPELCFQFHYFALRKMHFLKRAQALVIFPGGYGTMDELFETLCLIQTGKIDPIPVLLFGEDFWRKVVNFEAMADEGVISDADLELFSYVETAEDAWAAICRHYEIDPENLPPEGLLPLWRHKRRGR
jgi:uncharacterized protein (TIGR00730 family)